MLAAVSAVFLFASATTFQSLGVALFAMQASLHWSDAASGSVFMALGLSCCCLSMLPVALLPRIGGRWTMVAGCLGLASAFALAAACDGLGSLIAAALLMGLGYSLVANTPGIYPIAGWFGAGSPRRIGLYLTIGTVGGAIGPPMVQAFISDHGWRFYWMAMATTAILLALLCATLIREPPATEAGRTDAPPGQTRAALLSRPFLVIAAAMVSTQLGILTIAGIAPAHLTALGWSSGQAARFLGAQGLVGMAATAAAGWLAGRIHPRTMQAAALLCQAAGIAILAVTGSLWTIIAAALLFGAGWSVACVAITLHLIRLFGPRTGTTALSAIWMLSGLATAGPWAAGLWADHSGGSFTPALLTLATLAIPLVPLTLGLARQAHAQAGAS